jgi:Zinc finger, C2H2 type
MNKIEMRNWGYIYAILRKSDPTTIKIGSSKQFYSRISTYITSEPWFDNTSHKIWKFDIIESYMDCYNIDKQINTNSKKNNIPYEYLNGTGGKEHYKYNNDDMHNLCQYLDDNNIKYKMDLVDIDDIKLLIKKNKSAENKSDLFKCKICSHIFSTKGNLKIHLNRKNKCNPHTDFPYKCKFCNKIFKKKSNLNDHLNRKIKCTNIINNNHKQLNVLNNTINMNTSTLTKIIHEVIKKENMTKN